jgi:hypothetical protein
VTWWLPTGLHLLKVHHLPIAPLREQASNTRAFREHVRAALHILTTEQKKNWKSDSGGLCQYQYPIELWETHVSTEAKWVQEVQDALPCMGIYNDPKVELVT